MEAETQKACFTLAVLATRAYISQGDFGQNCQGAFRIGDIPCLLFTAGEAERLTPILKAPIDTGGYGEHVVT